MPPNPSDAPRRRTRNAAASRAAIVQAAVSHFTEEGFANASIDRITRDLDLTKGAVYHHFKDKTHLFEAAFLAVEDRFYEGLLAALRGVDDPRRRLATTWDLFLAECRRPEFLRLAVLEAPAALGWPRWRELEDQRLTGVVDVELTALHGGRPGDPGSATLLMGAAAAAGFQLSAAGATRAAAERQRLVVTLMRMVDGLSP